MNDQASWPEIFIAFRDWKCLQSPQETALLETSSKESEPKSWFSNKRFCLKDQAELRFRNLSSRQHYPAIAAGDKIRTTVNESGIFRIILDEKNKVIFQ